MGFKQLTRNVAHAEDATEANGRSADADLRQLKATWKAAWTPGRIVFAGLGAGFATGLIEPGRAAATGTSMLRLLSMATSLSGLVAGANAQAAAEEAGQAAEAVTGGAGAGLAAGIAAGLRGEAMDSERLARAADAARAAGAGS